MEIGVCVIGVEGSSIHISSPGSQILVGYPGLSVDGSVTRDNMYKSAVHAVELAYVFNNPDDDIYAGTVDLETAGLVQESWINFAKTGDPSIDGVEWKQYNTDTRDTMVIKKDRWECVSDPSKTARELLEKAFGDDPYHVW